MKYLATIIAAGAFVAGCGAPEPAGPVNSEPPATPDVSSSEATSEKKMTDLAPITIGPYTVQPMYEEELSDGHFNLKISGGEVAAVREWVGPEDASGVMVAKTEIERDYYHGHVEMPNAIPADARLWIEIETTDGQRLKGSTPLS